MGNQKSAELVPAIGVDRTEYARSQGYTGKQPVIVSDGRVISHANADWHEWIAAIRRAPIAPPLDVCIGPIVTVGIAGKGAIATLREESTLGGLILNRQIAIANAQLYVRAVNSHADLIAAIKLAIDECKSVASSIAQTSANDSQMDALAFLIIALKKTLKKSEVQS